MITYNVKLKFACKEDQERLNKTFLVHKKIWNYISEYVFNTQIELSSKKIHEKTYNKCRKLFPTRRELNKVFKICLANIINNHFIVHYSALVCFCKG